jgi:hypothetical protein
MSTNDSINIIPDDEIMEVFIKGILLSNQIIILIVFIWLIILLIGPNGVANNINNTISTFSSDCIPTGDKNIGWQQNADGSVETCDLSGNNNDNDMVNNILQGKISLDISGNWQKTYSDNLVNIGIFISLLLILSPYLLFIPKVLIRGLLWIIAKILFTINDNKNKTFQKFVEKEERKIETSGKTPKEIEQLLINLKERLKIEEDRSVIEEQEKLWKTLSKINEFIPTNKKETSTPSTTSTGGSSNNLIGGGIIDSLNTFSESVGGDKKTKGSSMRFFIGIMQIIFLIMLSLCISGNTIQITSVLFTIFICFLILFTTLGSLVPQTDSGFNMIFILLSAITIAPTLIINFFIKSNNNLSIQNIVSNFCLILSIGFLVYAFANPCDFKNPSKSTTSEGTEECKGNDYSVACLIYNFFASINDSLGFGLVKIFIIFLGILFVPNYENNSLVKTLQQNYGAPLYFLITIICIFSAFYYVFPLSGLIDSILNNKLGEQIPFYKTAANFIPLQECNLDISE